MGFGGRVRPFAAAALMMTACDDPGPPTVSPTPTPTPGSSSGVVPGAGTGSTEITLVAADPAPGSTLSGCGSTVSGCSGRIQMRFRLLSASGGRVLDATGFLHATNKLACYRGMSGPFDLQPGVPTEVIILFEHPDDAACAIPAEIANMKVVLSATVELAALQEWAVRYELRP